MFIVKAMRPSLTSDTESYSVFQCDYYVVEASTKNGTGTSDKPYVAPEKEVFLYEKSSGAQPNSTVAFLEVGKGDEHYCTVYVMNDRGRTIDTIQVR
jgi:hypothetical protein